MQGAEITAEVLYSQLMLERLRDPVVARGARMRSAWRAGAASSLPGYARLSDELRIASLTTTCLLLGVIAYNLISCAGWFCPSPSRAGPSRASNSGSSRDLRAPHSTCPVLHSSAGRKPVDSASVCADHPPHRAARGASDVIKSDGPCWEHAWRRRRECLEGGEAASGSPCDLRDQRLGVARTVPVTEHEWPDWGRQASRGPISSTRGKRT